MILLAILYHYFLSRDSYCFVGGLLGRGMARGDSHQLCFCLVRTAFGTFTFAQMSSRQHEHLNDLSQIRFLVIDEADRMVQQGSFPQLSRILEAVHEANPLDDESDEESLDGANDLDDYPDRLLGLPGIPGEAKVMMLGDVLDRIKQDQQNEERPDPVELTEDEYNVQMRMEENDDNDEDYDDDDSEGLLEMPSLPPVPRQTFVYSATLTLDPLASYSQKQLQRNAKRKTKLPKSVDGALAQILEKAHASGLTKVVDLTSDKKRTQKQGQQTTLQQQQQQQQQQSSGVKLPPGLTLYTIKCTQKHKDSHLYAYLVTTSQGASGPCLVFCNSIAAVKRVGMTLQTLKLPVRMLHANMPQVSQLFVSFSFQTKNSNEEDLHFIARKWYGRWNQNGCVSFYALASLQLEDGGNIS